MRRDGTGFLRRASAMAVGAAVLVCWGCRTQGGDGGYVIPTKTAVLEDEAELRDAEEAETEALLPDEMAAESHNPADCRRSEAASSDAAGQPE